MASDYSRRNRIRKRRNTRRNRKSAGAGPQRFHDGGGVLHKGLHRLGYHHGEPQMRSGRNGGARRLRPGEGISDEYTQLHDTIGAGDVGGMSIGYMCTGDGCVGQYCNTSSPDCYLHMDHCQSNCASDLEANSFNDWDGYNCIASGFAGGDWGDDGTCYCTACDGEIHTFPVSCHNNQQCYDICASFLNPVGSC